MQEPAQAYSLQMQAAEAKLAQTPHDVVAEQEEVSAAKAWALSEVQAKHPEAGMEILERGLERVPTSTELLTAFGVEATLLRQFAIAEQALGAALKLKPNDPTALYALARLEVEEQRLPEAERDLKAYLAMRPGDASAYYGLGHIYAMEQRSVEAKAAFERSVALQPVQTESYYQLGQIALEAQQDAEAQALFTKALARAPRHAGALTGMGQIALREKQYAQAEELLRAAEQSDPQYAAPHYFRGLALAHLGRKAEADDELKRGDGRQHVTMPDAPAASGNAGSEQPRQP